MIKGQSFPLDRARYAVGITWDRARKDVDLDLQVVMVDSQGIVCEAIYHNNLTALNGAVTHTGDDKGGDNDKTSKELVWVDTSKLPMRIKMLIFVVAACSGGHLVDVRKGTITVVDCRSQKVMARYHMENSHGDVDAVVMMVRSSFGRWQLGPIDELAVEGESFMDIMDVLGRLIKAEIPEAPAKQEMNCIMDKDAGGTGAAGLASQVQVALHARNRRRVALPLSTYSARLRWMGETLLEAVDLQTMLVDERGNLVQLVDSLNVCSLAGEVAVPEDLEAAEEGGEREVHIDLATIDASVRLVIFSVALDASYGPLSHVEDLSMVLTDCAADKSKARFSVQTQGVQGNCKIFMMFHRLRPGMWEMLQSDEGHHESSNVFLARALLGKLIREFIPHAPQDDHIIKLLFGNGSAVGLPDSAPFRRVTCNVCWNCLPSTRTAPAMHVSVLLLDDCGRLMGVASEQHTRVAAPGGDAPRSPASSVISVATAARPANEQEGLALVVGLSTLPKMITQVVLVVNSPDASLDVLANLNCYLFDQVNMEVARYAVSALPPKTPGNLVARFLRDDRRRWTFQAVGQPCGGNTWSNDQCMQAVRKLAEMSVACVQESADAPGEDPEPAKGDKPVERKTMHRRSVLQVSSKHKDDESFEAPMPLAVAPQLLLSTVAQHLSRRRTTVAGRKPVVNGFSRGISGGFAVFPRLISRGNFYREESAEQADAIRRPSVFAPTSAIIAEEEDAG